jgi:hypothetical protein
MDARAVPAEGLKAIWVEGITQWPGLAAIERWLRHFEVPLEPPYAFARQ